jgi:formate hydrogenlyase subunit 3/multisubunit Na+/H+ antiporter MnhD subunit
MLFFLYLLLYGNSLIPFPSWTGIGINGFGIDNRNIGSTLLILVLFPIIYRIASFESKTSSFSFLLIFVLLALLLCFLFKSLSWLFLVYECLIIALLFIFLSFLPPLHRIRTAFSFSVSTIFGTISFTLSLSIMISSKFLFSLIIVIPFLIKIPSFPFFYWLPEVHCEANTPISLLSAGILLKLSIYGLIRFVLSSLFLSLRILCSVIVSFTLLGIIVATSSCFRYYDLKKIIAFSSIIHPNLSLVSISSMNSSSILSSIFISVSHGLSSISLSLIAGLVKLVEYCIYHRLVLVTGHDLKDEFFWLSYYYYHHSINYSELRPEHLFS